MKLRVRDIVCYQGQDLVVEGLLTYRVGGKTHVLARLVDRDTVLWLEPQADDSEDRLLLFSEIDDVDVETPPPPTISHQGRSYLPRFSGTATVELAGRVPDRVAGSCELWRYRAAGDHYLQIERWADRRVTL